MTSIESYVIAILFICINGFICGRSTELTRKKNSGDIKYDGSFIIGIAAILSSAVSFVYGVMWVLVIFGPYFIWLPGLIAWFIGLSFGHRWIKDNWRSSSLWKSQATLGLASPATYHIIHKYLVY
ncbi:MAG: hypothetical protein KUG60_01170 [Gammaproteobacteria bacterium]|nr:hypothetical protein [Gammaproteobacteria bacterium]